MTPEDRQWLLDNLERTERRVLALLERIATAVERAPKRSKPEQGDLVETKLSAKELCEAYVQNVRALSSAEKIAIQSFAVLKAPDIDFWSEVDAFIRHFRSNGYKIGGKALMKDPEAAMEKWLIEAQRRVQQNRQRSGKSAPAAAKFTPVAEKD